MANTNPIEWDRAGLMIPITVVQFGEDEERLVLEVLRSGNIAQGARVSEFENAFANLIGVKHAIALNNGTTSLVASLQLLDLKPGDEVITSPFTFIATLNSILEAGATARFADISEDDFNVTAASLSGAITDKTRVLMPVHLYGQMADMEAISSLAEERHLHVVEDAAQAHGASQNGRSAGTFGLGSFSFYATKNITTGEGGMITTNDDELAAKARILRNQGMKARYQYESVGHNYRMTDLQAALGLPQISRYDRLVAARQNNAAYLTEGISSIPGIVPPSQIAGRRHVWHQYTVRVTEASGVTRDEFLARLNEAGVGNGVYYPKLVFDYPPYRDRSDVHIGRYPIAERIVTEVVSLPVHPNLTKANLDAIIATIATAARGR